MFCCLILFGLVEKLGEIFIFVKVCYCFISYETFICRLGLDTLLFLSVNYLCLSSTRYVLET